MDDSTVPMDVTAEHAEKLVRAALAWRWDFGRGGRQMSRVEWELFDAATNYGDEYKGLRAS